MFGLQVAEWGQVVRDVGFPIALCGVFLWITVYYLIPGLRQLIDDHRAQNAKQGELFAETIKEHGVTLKELNHDSNVRSEATVSAIHDLVTSIQPLQALPSKVDALHDKIDGYVKHLPNARARAARRVATK